MPQTYKIVRFYFDSDYYGPGANPVCKEWTGLNLAEAQAHCNHPETSSSTCTNPEKVEHTRIHGNWFDGYTDETDEVDPYDDYIFTNPYSEDEWTRTVSELREEESYNRMMATTW